MFARLPSIGYAGVQLNLVNASHEIGKSRFVRDCHSPLPYFTFLFSRQDPFIRLLVGISTWHHRGRVRNSMYKFMDLRRKNDMRNIPPVFARLLLNSLPKDVDFYAKKFGTIRSCM